MCTYMITEYHHFLKNIPRFFDLYALCSPIFYVCSLLRLYLLQLKLLGNLVEEILSQWHLVWCETSNTGG